MALKMVIRKGLDVDGKEVEVIDWESDIPESDKILQEYIEAVKSEFNHQGIKAPSDSELMVMVGNMLRRQGTID